MFSISTKYVKRVATGEFHYAQDGSVTFTTTPDAGAVLPTIQRYPCSGCGLSYGSTSGLSVHYAIYTSGGTKALECAAVMSR